MSKTQAKIRAPVGQHTPTNVVISNLYSAINHEATELPIWYRGCQIQHRLVISYKGIGLHQYTPVIGST